MHCKICGKEFARSKYHPKQEVCLKPACQRNRQLENEKAWRIKNPDYFKYLGQEEAWLQKRSRYTKLWRQTHKEEIKEYGKSHQQERRQYMREYMKNYRLKMSQLPLTETKGSFEP